MYGTHGPVKSVRGKVHDYLGMKFDFSIDGKVVIGMIDYMESMVDEFSEKINKSSTVPNPATDKLFSVDETAKLLDKSRAEEFHSTVYKGLFACKRTRPDILTAITFLCARVKAPTEEDWDKLKRLLKYVNCTRKDILTLSANDLRVLKWYVDASFAVHPDFKSHTGAIMTMGGGAIQSISRKQKLNTRSSAEAELVGADDAATMILWTRLFLEAQGYDVKENILYQDNMSTILLENNGKRSSSKRTRALNIRYFFLTDQIEKGNVSVEYCPTKEMIGDYMSKPLQGKLFKNFKDLIMGNKLVSSPKMVDDRSVLNVYHSSIKKKTENTACRAPSPYSVNNENFNGHMGVKMTRKIQMAQPSAKTGPTDARTRRSESLKKRINLGCTSPTFGYMEPDKCPVSEAQTQY